MDVRLVFPRFTNPPADYDRKYFADLVRSLDNLVTILQAAGEGRQTTIVLTNLATNDYNLEPGTIFQVNGALRVSVPYSPYPAGISSLGSVGSVTVTT
jgi:hypothetical protein